MLSENVKKTLEEIKKEELPEQTGVDVHAETQTPLGISDVVTAVRHLGSQTENLIKIILAVYASTFIEKKDPIWLMIVGNPSSNKTTLVDLLSGLEDVYRIDTMTANPFSSGQRESDKPKDLLPLLYGKCLIIKEYGAIFGRGDEVVKQLIGELVAIYDGEYSKHSPTRGTIKYESYFSHIGCVTPMALNARQRYMNAVGARFLFFRVPVLTEIEKDSNLKDVWLNSAKLSKGEVGNCVKVFCNVLKDKVKLGATPTFPENVQNILNKMALLIARARGIVITEQNTFNTPNGHEMKHYEVVDKQVEEPFRALMQLKKLAGSLALVNGNDIVGEEELQLLRLVVLSSMHVRRADVLNVFKKGHSFTAKKASDLLNKNYKTVKRNLDELVALEILQDEKGGNDLARAYCLKEEFLPILCPDRSPVVQNALKVFGQDTVLDSDDKEDV